jgi:hypothetical protein
LLAKTFPKRHVLADSGTDCGNQTSNPPLSDSPY